MADITGTLDIGTGWSNITVDLLLLNGVTYAVDVVGAANKAIAYWAVTDNTSQPDTNGHPLNPADRDLTIDTRVLDQVAGQYLWMRVDRGTATVVATEE